MSKAKQFIAIFYISLIVLFKVGGLHGLSHNADDVDLQHCEVCHISTVANFTPLLETETAVVPENKSFFVEEKINDKAFFVTYSNKHLSSYLFTRPPPLFS